MNAQQIMSSGTNRYNSTMTETGTTKQYSKESANFSEYLSGNLKFTNQYQSTEPIGKSARSEKLVENKLMNVLDKKSDQKVTDSNNVTNKTTIASKVNELANQMKDVVKDTLEIDDKELAQIMSQLGFTVIDLLNPDNLKMLCMEAAGESDILALLTNEDLSNQLSALLGTLDNMNLNELPISEEELQTLLADYNKEQKVTTTDIPQEVQESQILSQDEEQVVADSTNELPSGDEDLDTKGNKDIRLVIEQEGKQSTHQNQALAGQGVDNGNLSKDELEATKTEASSDPVKEQFFNNLMQTTVSNVEVVNGQTNMITQIRDIVNQIVSEIRVKITPDMTNMELQLNPDNLGKVNLSIVTKEGMLTAQFRVDNQVTKEAIESQMHTLRENLTNQGIKVQSIEVTVSNFSFAESNQTFESNPEQKENRKFIQSDGYDDDTIGQEVDSVEELMRDNGNTVNYTA